MGWFKSLCDALAGRADGPVRKPVDHGGGLTRLPDPDPDAGKKYDAHAELWVTYEDAARATLALYEAGRWSAQGGVCPRCYEVNVGGNAAYLSHAHPNAAARRRWEAVHREHLGMIAAYGDCRCGQHKTLDEAEREAEAFNAPYMHRMG